MSRLMAWDCRCFVLFKGSVVLTTGSTFHSLQNISDLNVIIPKDRIDILGLEGCQHENYAKLFTSQSESTDF